MSGLIGGANVVEEKENEPEAHGSPYAILEFVVRTEECSGVLWSF